MSPQQSRTKTVYLGHILDSGNDNWQHLKWITGVQTSAWFTSGLEQRVSMGAPTPLRHQLFKKFYCIWLNKLKPPPPLNDFARFPRSDPWARVPSACTFMVMRNWATCIIYTKPPSSDPPAASLLRRDGIKGRGAADEELADGESDAAREAAGWRQTREKSQSVSRPD